MARYLADTSAWHWSARAADRWTELLEGDEVAICTPVALELLFSARGPADYRKLADDLSGLTWVTSSPNTDAAARRTQAVLSERSQHRGATPVDVLVAAHAARSTSCSFITTATST